MIEENLPLSYAALAGWIYAIVKPNADWSAELISGLTIPFIAFLVGRDSVALLELEERTEDVNKPTWVMIVGILAIDD